MELTFYALAPFLNRLRTSVLLLLLALSTSARLLTYHHYFLTFDPWTHRFFPFEIALFLAGMLGYRFYTRLERQVSTDWKLRTPWQYALGTAVLLVLFHQSVTLTSTLGLFTDWYVAILISYVGWACLIPVLFFVFGDLRADRVFGELSYPIYLVHELVIVSLVPVMGWLGIEKRLGVAVACASVAVAAVWYRCGIAPAERRRHRLTVDTVRPAPTHPLPFAVPTVSP